MRRGTGGGRGRCARGPLTIDCPSTYRITTLQPLPGFEDEAAGAVFAVLAEFFVFEDAEGFAGEVAGGGAGGIAGRVERVGDFFAGVEDVFQFAGGEVGGVEDVAELLAGEAVEAGIVGIQLGAQDGAAVFIPAEGGTLIAHIFSKKPKIICCKN